MAIAKLVNENLKMENDLEGARESYAKLLGVHEDLKMQTDEERQQQAIRHSNLMKVQSGKIDDLQHRVNHLESCNAQLSSAHVRQGENLKETIKRLNEELTSKVNENAIATRTIERLEKQLQEANVSSQSIEIKRLTAENRVQSSELLDLKRQLRNSMDSSRGIHEVQQALAASNIRIRFLEQEKSEVIESARSELQVAGDMHRQLEQVLQEMEAQGSYLTGTKSNDQNDERIGELEAEVKALKKELSSKLALSKDVKVTLPQDSSLTSSEPKEVSNGSDSRSRSQLVENQDDTRRHDSGSKIQGLQQSQLNAENEYNNLDESIAAEGSVLESTLQSTKQTVDVRTGQVTSQQTNTDARCNQATNGMSNEISNALDEARKSLEVSEKSIIKTYEDRLAQKEVTIRELQQDLAAVRNHRVQEVSELNRELGVFRSKFAEIHKDYDQQLKTKDQHAYALEHALHSQEQILDAMRTEMNQLQQSMQDTTAKRRGEVEELQEEVIALRTEMSRREKERTNLQMQLKEMELQHKAEVLKLKEVVSDLEGELPLIKTISNIENDQRIRMVRERLDQLKHRNAELKEENRCLGERLEKNIIKIHGLETEASEANDAKIECEILRKKVAELQETLGSVHGRGPPFSLKKNADSDSGTEVSSTALDRSGRPELRRARTMNTPIRRFFGKGRSSSATRTAMIDDETDPSKQAVATGRRGRRLNL
jgi:hypothetical protein